ncbi:MAG: PorP/SprF family type IX secretion system membrane protein [Saprospiraceae bacterium]
MRKVYLLTVGILLSLVVSAQRDFQVNQFMYDKVNVNPAFVGANYTSTVSLIDNSLLGGGGQIASGQVARATAKLLDTGVGLGVSFEGFTVGDFEATEMSAIYSYHSRVGDEQYLSFGLEGSFRTITSSLFANEFQPPITIVGGNANFGGLYYDQSLYIGVSAQNMLGNQIEDPFGGDIPLSSGKRLFRGQVGAAFSLGGESELQPNVQVAYVTEAPIGYDVNVMYVWKRTFSGGLSYRYADFPEAITRNNIDLILQMKVNKSLRIGTGFTFPQASASVQSGGGEVSVIWVWSAEERPFQELPFF